MFLKKHSHTYTHSNSQTIFTKKWHYTVLMTIYFEREGGGGGREGEGEKEG